MQSVVDEAVATGAGATAFARLKGLAGQWRGNRPDGREVEVDYRTSALDSALVETWNLGPGCEALTIYHMDGNDLMASHFCPQGNQPRLKMRRASGSRFDFSFHDATGVDPGEGVQQSFWIEIGEDGTITRSETYVQGDTTESETITYRRVTA